MALEEYFAGKWVNDELIERVEAHLTHDDQLNVTYWMAGQAISLAGPEAEAFFDEIVGGDRDELPKLQSPFQGAT